MNDTPEKGGYNIETLMRQYGNDVLRTCGLYVSDRSSQEDLFQETFIKAYYNLNRFKGESSIKTWLIKIAINVCKDYLKSAYQQKVVPMMDFAEDAIVSEDDYEEVENADRNGQIKKAVMSLPEAYRDVVICVYYREMSVTEASEALGVPPGTVKSRLSRARETLKSKLEGRL